VQVRGGEWIQRVGLVRRAMRLSSWYRYWRAGRKAEEGRSAHQVRGDKKQGEDFQDEDLKRANMLRQVVMDGFPAGYSPSATDACERNGNAMGPSVSPLRSIRDILLYTTPIHLFHQSSGPEMRASARDGDVGGE